MNKYEMPWSEVIDRITNLKRRSYEVVKANFVCQLYGVPRGGSIVAAMLFSNSPDKYRLVDRPEASDLIVDDVVVSGKTRDRFSKYGKPFLSLINKQEEGETRWVVFPWEQDVVSDGIEGHITRLIEFMGDDPNRHALQGTPDRVARSLTEMSVGYRTDPKSVLKWFDSNYKDMVVVRDISFSSMCEHHMLPFYGSVDIGYIPNGKIIGVSKLSRIVDVLSKRLQIQEELTAGVVDTIIGAPEGNVVSAVAYAKGVHMCMVSRGVGRWAEMVTVYPEGDFKSDPSLMSEFHERRRG